MRMGDIELRHIVDVDGQLIGIDAAFVDVSTLLRRAGRGLYRRVFMVRAGERTAISPQQRIRLSEGEVLFFETMPAPMAQALMPSPILTSLAA